MVTRYGMSEKLGTVAYERDPRTFLTGPDMAMPPREREYAEATAATVDAEVREMLDRVFKRAVDILTARRDVLERAARRLLEKETLEENELIELVGPPASPPFKQAAE